MLALGPFFSAWCGPQRIVLTIEGDTVVDVSYRGGYNERDCEERLSQLPADQALHLVTRICGRDSHAHALAFCHALETLLEVRVVGRVAYLRSVVAEIERLASHLYALVNIFTTLGQHSYTTVLQELCESVRQAMLLVSGSRIIPDICVPGGLRRDLSVQQSNKLRVLLAKLNRQLSNMLERITGDATLSARTVDIGTLGKTAVEQFSLCGPLARASGVECDTRLQEPYAAYSHLSVSHVLEEGGDVYARLIVFILEAFDSVKLIDQALHDMPSGRWKTPLPEALPVGTASAAVESPHGTVRYTLESDGRRLTSVKIDAPWQIDRLLARALFVGAMVDDVVLIALSTDSCVACSEC